MLAFFLQKLASPQRTHSSSHGFPYAHHFTLILSSRLKLRVGTFLHQGGASPLKGSLAHVWIARARTVRQGYRSLNLS